MAADWPAEKFEKAVGTIYGKVRSVGRSSNAWQTHMIALDKLLILPRGAYAGPSHNGRPTDDRRLWLSAICQSSPGDGRLSGVGWPACNALGGSCGSWRRAELRRADRRGCWRVARALLGWGPACEPSIAWGVPEHHHKSMLCLSWLAGMVGRVDARNLREP